MKEQERFDKVIVDADTPIFKASLSVQEMYVIVTHISSGREMEFRNQTEFWGHHTKKAGGWLSKTNSERAEKGLEPFLVEDFSLDERVRLIEGIDHLAEAERHFDMFIGVVKRMPTDDYLLCIGGDGNYRYDEAHILPYKGERKDKPLLFLEVREMLINKYKNKVLVCDGEEADDMLGKIGYKNYLKYRKTGKWEYLLSYIDKDLKMIISPYINYHNVEQGIQYVTPESAAKHFCCQLLSGDKATDNIQGLPNLTEEVRRKYNIGAVRGVGDATALKLINCADSITDMFNIVTEAYRGFYGEDEFDFVSHRGEESKRTWLDMLQENALLLWMRRADEEMYDIRDTLDKLGVDYE